MAITPSNPSALINTDVELTSLINNAVWTSIPSLNALFSAGSTSYKKKFQASVAGTYEITAMAGYSSINAKYTQLSNGDLEINVDWDGSYPVAQSAATLFNVGDWFEIEWVADSGADSRKFHVKGGGSPQFAFSTNFATNEVSFFYWYLITGDKIFGEVILDGGDKKLKLYKNGVHQVTFNDPITTTRTIFYQPYSGVNAGAICKPIKSHLSESTNVTIIAPVSANFTAPTSINLGEDLSVEDTSTNGFGAKLRKWYVDDFHISSKDNQTTPTFSDLAAGAHTIKLEVSDDVGIDEIQKDIFVGTVSGVDNVQNGGTSSFTTNVPNANWSVVDGIGDGSFSSNNFTGSDVGTVTIKATNSLNTNQFATKTITVFEPLSVDWSIPNSVINYGESFVANSILIGTPPYSYQWLINEALVSISQNLNRNNVAVGIHDLKLIGTDSVSFNEKTGTFTVKPVISTPSTLRLAQIGKPFSFQFPRPTGSDAGTFAVISGDLVSEINSAGLLSIESVADENYSFTLRYTDISGVYVDKNFTLPVSSLAIFDFCYKYPLGTEHRKKVAMFRPPQGSRQTRTIISKKRKLTMILSFFGREKEQAILEFWDEHYPAKNFLIWDEYKEEYFEAFFNSNLKENRKLFHGDAELIIEEA